MNDWSGIFTKIVALVFLLLMTSDQDTDLVISDAVAAGEERRCVDTPIFTRPNPQHWSALLSATHIFPSGSSKFVRPSLH